MASAWWACAGAGCPNARIPAKELACRPATELEISQGAPARRRQRAVQGTLRTLRPILPPLLISYVQFKNIHPPPLCPSYLPPTPPPLAVSTVAVQVQPRPPPPSSPPSRQQQAVRTLEVAAPLLGLPTASLHLPSTLLLLVVVLGLQHGCPLGAMN